MSINRGMDKDVVPIYSGALLSHKRHEIGSSIEMWIELETVIHSEVSQKQILYIIAYMWNLEKWYRQSYLQNRDTDVEKNKHMDTKGGKGK